MSAPSTPLRAAREAKRQLARLARPSGSFDASRYFRTATVLGFHNTGTAAMRALARAIYLEHRAAWTIDEAMHFADALIRDRHLETKSVGIEVVARYRRAFTPALLARWKRWLADNHSANWATTDTLCGELLGPLLVDRPVLAERLRAWASDRNMWVRRASVVALIAPVRKRLALDLLYDNAQRLHGDKEDLIQKAVGWALREAGKVDTTRLERYLRANGPSIPRTTVRYAIERFPPAKRAALLKETRRGKRSDRGRSIQGTAHER
jgi:3-methyladenine DNA glycosylase AlkD